MNNVGPILGEPLRQKKLDFHPTKPKKKNIHSKCKIFENLQGRRLCVGQLNGKGAYAEPAEPNTNKKNSLDGGTNDSTEVSV